MNRLLIAAVSALVISAPTGADAQQVRSRGAEGALYDANGKRIGPFEAYSVGGVGSGGEVLTKFGSAIVRIPLRPVGESFTGGAWSDPTRLVPVGSAPLFGGSVYFASTDCRGPAFLSGQLLSSGRAGVQPSSTFADGSGAGTLYIANAVAPQQVQIGSIISWTDGTCVLTQRPELVIPVTQVVDLNVQFKAPYTLR